MFAPTTGSLRLSFMPISNGDFKQWQYYATPTYQPDGWSLSAEGAVYAETSSTFWGPGWFPRSAVRMAAASHASINTSLVQYINSGTVNQQAWYRMISAGSHCLRANAWVFLPNSSNRPNSGDCSVGASVVGLGATLTSCAILPNSIHGWYFLESPALHYFIDSGDLIGSNVYFSLRLDCALARVFTIWATGARMQVDGIELYATRAEDTSERAGWEEQGLTGQATGLCLGRNMRVVLDSPMSAAERERLRDWWENGVELCLRTGTSHDLTAWGGLLPAHYGVNCSGLPAPRLYHDCLLVGGSFPIDELDGPTLEYFQGRIELLEHGEVGLYLGLP